METRIVNGKAVADAIRAEVVQEIASLREEGLTPGLAVVLVGDDPASQTYVASKTRACRDLGMVSENLKLPAETTTAELLQVIGRLNRDDTIDGILVQLPLPPQIDAQAALQAVHPGKDVDGFNPVNVGKLCLGTHLIAPCTPLGILAMLDREGIALSGAHAVVVGRSNIVGKPMAHLLLQRNCTVTVCHSRTRDLPGVCREADILVAAVGRPAIITREFIREGAVVIDVGINRIETREEVVHLFGEESPKVASLQTRGSVLVGDVHPRDPLGLAAVLTPVPGGVGPLTIAQLMKNTVTLCKARRAAPVRQPHG